MCSVYMSQLRRSSLESNFDSSFIIFSNDEINRTAPFPNREKVLDMVEPKRRDRHQLGGNRIKIVSTGRVNPPPHEQVDGHCRECDYIRPVKVEDYKMNAWEKDA